MTDLSYLAAVRESYDTVAAEYARQVKFPAGRAGGVRVRIDLSPAMVELARQAYPELDFTVGSMTALAIDDGELAGILAYYSVHHTPPELLPVVFGEFHRTLAPGGRLMLAGHAGTGEHLRPTQAYGGRPVSYESYLTPPDRTAELLEAAGFVITAQLLEPPGEGTKRTVATFLARKPGPPNTPDTPTC
ncbi:methyltransferase [Streptomyces kurssanovii]|nr:methyltransferase [Streptomyces kurssanovii]